MCVCVHSALLYEVIYTQVFNVEEAELYQAMESARMGGRCYRNSVSISSEVDFSYDTPEDRGQRYTRPKLTQTQGNISTDPECMC